MPPVDTSGADSGRPHVRPGRSRLRSETRRAVVSAVAATIITFGVEVFWLSREPELRAHAWAVGCVVAWTLFAAGHTLLTHLVYRNATAADFAADHVASMERSHRGEHRTWRRRMLAAPRAVWHRWWHRGSEAPSWSVQVSVLALIVVATIMVTPALRASQALLFAALAMVASSWANVVVMYAVHYARLDTAHQGLRFAGDEPRRFVDYLYVAVAVQTTFGTTDVEICTQRFRRTTLTQSVLAFVFNSVIVAMIVSLLLSVVV